MPVFMKFAKNEKMCANNTQCSSCKTGCSIAAPVPLLMQNQSNNTTMNVLENVAPLNSAAAGKSASGLLANPHFDPSQIVLATTLTANGGVTQIYFEDAIALGITLGLVGGANSQTLTAQTIGNTTLKEYLKTYGLIISGYDFDCTTASELAKNLIIYYSSIDQNSASKTLFSSVARTNMQYNANLLNIANPFVWTNTANLKMTTAAPTSNTTYTFTFYIAAAVAYGNITQWLKENAIMDRNITRKC